MKKRIKICYIGDAQSVHTRRWVKWFAKDGYDVHLITDRIGNIENVKMYFVKEGRNFFSFINEIITVRKIVKKIKPDILHSHYASSYGVFGAFSKNCPLIISVWGSDVIVDPEKSFIVKYLLKFALRKADLITSDGENTRKIMTEKFKINIDKIKIIYHGVDTSKFNHIYKDETLIKRLFGKKFPTIISVRLLESKNDFVTLIKSIPIVLKNNKDVKFIIGGKGPKEEELKNLIENLGITENVKLIGWISHDKLPKYLASSDIYVSTSLWDGGISIVTLNAMACKLAPIVTDVANNSQWIKDGENGFIIPEKNYKLLAEKIIYLLNNEKIRNKFGDISRKIVIEKQQEYKEMGKMEKIYEKIMEK